MQYFFSIHCSQPFENAEGVYEPKVSWILTDTRASGDGMWVMLRKTFENGEEVSAWRHYIDGCDGGYREFIFTFPYCFFLKNSVRRSREEGLSECFLKPKLLSEINHVKG